MDYKEPGLDCGSWDVQVCSHRVSGVSAAGKAMAAQKRRGKKMEGGRSCSFLMILSLVVGNKQELFVFEDIIFNDGKQAGKMHLSEEITVFAHKSTCKCSPGVLTTCWPHMAP